MGTLKWWPGFSEAFVIGLSSKVAGCPFQLQPDVGGPAVVQHHCTTPTEQGVCQQPCAVPTNRSVTVPSLLQTSIWLISLTRLWRQPPGQPSPLPSPSPGQGSQVRQSSSLQAPASIPGAHRARGAPVSAGIVQTPEL